jgi:hypothetical protein
MAAAAAAITSTTAMAQCSDAIISGAFQTTAGRAPTAQECNRGRYAGGDARYFANTASLIPLVKASFVCQDPWIAQAYYVLGKPINGHDPTVLENINGRATAGSTQNQCNSTNYGSWPDFPTLVRNVQNYFSPTAAPKPVAPAPAPAPTTTAPPPPDMAAAGVMYTSQLNSGLCLAVRNGQIANSSTLMTWNCIAGDPSQTFYLSNGLIRIGSPSSQYCIASFNGQNSGSPIGVWQCQGLNGKAHPTQAFSLGMYSDLHMTNTNLCLNVQGGNKAAGTPVILYQCSSGSAAGDMWHAQRPGAPPPTPTPTPAPSNAQVTVTSFHLISRMGSRCLAVPNGNRSPGTTLIQWDCLDSAEQTFQFMANGQIAAFGGTAGLCLDDKGGMNRAGDAIQTWPCAQSTSKWTFSNGQIKPVNVSNMCIDLWGGWGGRIVAPNQTAQLYTCNNQDNQSWVAAVTLPKGNSQNPIPAATQVTITSHYPGQIISHNGSAVIAAGAGNVIAAGAGNVIAAGAGNVIAAGAGNVIAAGAGNVLVPVGAGVVVSTGPY